MLTSLQPENISKHRDRVAQHYCRKLLLKWQWHFILVKVASVDLCPCTESEVNKEFIYSNVF